MNRKEAALFEMIKRGGTANERRVACDKLMLLSGKDYSYLLPKEDKELPKNELTIKSSFEKLVEEIKNNFPISFDLSQNLWRGSKGLIITMEQLMDMTSDEYKRLNRIFNYKNEITKFD